MSIWSKEEKKETQEDKLYQEFKKRIVTDMIAKAIEIFCYIWLVILVVTVLGVCAFIFEPQIDRVLTFMGNYESTDFLFLFDLVSYVTAGLINYISTMPDLLKLGLVITITFPLIVLFIMVLTEEEEKEACD